MSKVLIPFLLLNLIGLFIGCDSDRYLSYNFTVDSPAKVTKISGVIKHLYTGEGVKNAQITFDTQFVESANNGEFLLNFILSGDEQFDKTYPVRITAEGYYPLDTTIVIYPNENVASYVLDYGAPVVLSAELTAQNLAFATVRDYQGISTIDTVTVLGYFIDTVPGSNRTVWLEYPMVRTQILDERTAIYEGFIQYDNDLPGSLVYSRMRVFARDNEGFEKDQVFLFDNISH